MAFEGPEISRVELPMETFGNDLSKTDKHAFELCLEKVSRAEDREKAKFFHKMSEEANKLSYDTGPWWRLADGEELAYLVSHRSVNLIENCDLPHPQSSHFRGWDPYGNFSNFKPYQHLNARAATNNKQGNCISRLPKAQDIENDPTKAQLLEALGRCQTRARGAETLANQACAEKEQIIKLFFREASHLFAYKQWFQLLQLENLHFQNKMNENNNNKPSSISCGVDLTSFDRKTRKLHKIKYNRAKRKHIGRQSICDYVSKLGIAFGRGFGLIGAGLLLGWTVGWFFSLF